MGADCVGPALERGVGASNPPPAPHEYHVHSEVDILQVKLAVRTGLVETPLAFRLLRQFWIIAFLAVAPHPANAQQAPPAPQVRFVIVLDAAHGGEDAGGHLAENQLEKSITLAMSVRLRSLLTARGMQVVTTRDTDATVEPNRRAEIANHAQAQACLILHASESGSGIHLFASSLQPAAPERFAAWKTAQAGFVTRSLALAGVLNSTLLQAGMSVTLGRTNLPGMDSMTCPAVAVEIAPERSTDNQPSAGLDDSDYQAKLATALAAALVEWRAEVRQP
jgi:N-acetylmuramoyl-L-alanine amidase